MTDEHFTPAWLFDELAIPFDLDVCAPSGGAPWVPAARHYSLADDGLSQAWEGRVWMNPPFSAPVRWVERFLGHRHGIALLPFTKAHWFEDVWRSDAAIAFPGVRLSTAFRIYMPCCLAAFGEECTKAIARTGAVR